MDTDIKYKKCLNEFLRKCFYSDWMTEGEFSEMLKLMYERTELSEEKLVSYLKKGEANGYSLNHQFSILEATFKASGVVG